MRLYLMRKPSSIEIIEPSNPFYPWGHLPWSLMAQNLGIKVFLLAWGKGQILIVMLSGKFGHCSVKSWDPQRIKPSINDRKITCSSEWHCFILDFGWSGQKESLLITILFSCGFGVGIHTAPPKNTKKNQLNIKVV